MAKQIVLLLPSPEMIPPLLLCLPPEAAGATIQASGSVTFVTGTQKDQQNMVPTGQKDLYMISNFILISFSLKLSLKLLQL